MFNEIAQITGKFIPAIVSPNRIVYITPEFTLHTGRLVQLNKHKRHIELDFSANQTSLTSQQPIYNLSRSFDIGDNAP